jgi:hypothetical protein
LAVTPETFTEPVGYFIDPLVWVGSAPAGIEPPQPANDVDFRAFEDIVVQHDLLDGDLKCRVERDGLVVFDFETVAPSPDGHGRDHLQRRVEIANAHQACLCDALYRQESRARSGLAAVTPHSFLRLSGRNEPGQGAVLPRTPSGSGAYFARFEALHAEHAIDLRLIRIETISISAMKASLELLDVVLAKGDQIVGLLDLMLRAAAAYTDHNFSLSLIQSWAVSEALVRRVWARYVNENREREIDGSVETFINAERKQWLTGSRDITASVMIEMLSLASVISLDIYERLGKARRARNRWLHSLFQPPADEAQNALGVTSALLSIVEEIDISIPLSLQW